MPTLLLGYKSPLFLVVFEVQPNLSPRLQNTIAVVSIAILMVLKKVCCTVLLQVSLSMFVV